MEHTLIVTYSITTGSYSWLISWRWLVVLVGWGRCPPLGRWWGVVVGGQAGSLVEKRGGTRKRGVVVLSALYIISLTRFRLSKISVDKYAKT